MDARVGVTCSPLQSQLSLRRVVCSLDYVEFEVPEHACARRESDVSADTSKQKR